MDQKLRSEPPFHDKNCFLRHLINALSYGKNWFYYHSKRFTKLNTPKKITVSKRFCLTYFFCYDFFSHHNPPHSCLLHYVISLIRNRDWIIFMKSKNWLIFWTVVIHSADAMLRTREVKMRSTKSDLKLFKGQQRWVYEWLQ